MGNEDRHLWQFQWVRELIILLIIGLIAWMAYSIRAVLSPILIGLALAYVVNPVVTWAQIKRRIPRWFSTSIILLLSMFSILMVGLIALPRMMQQVSMLVGNLKAYTRVLLVHMHITPSAVQGWIGSIIERDVEVVEDIEQEIVADIQSYEAEHNSQANPDSQTTYEDGSGDMPGEVAPDEAGQELSADGDALADEMGDPTMDPESAASAFPHGELLSEQTFEIMGKTMSVVMRGLDIGVGVVGSTIGLASYLTIAVIVIVFCFFFFSWRFDRIIAWFNQFIPNAHREKTVRIITRMDKSVSAFIRGRLIQSLTMGLVLSVGWWAAGVPYWLLLGILSGFLNLIPFAAVVGCVAAVTLAVFDHLAGGGGFSVWVIAWPLIIYAFAQVLDGWVVEPIVQGKATDLDPLAVLLAVLIGSSLAGLLGLILAIPVTACLKIIAEEVVVPKARSFMTELEID